MAQISYWLLRWFDYYPVALALAELLGSLRPDKSPTLLAALNLTTAGLGLLWLLVSSYGLFIVWSSQAGFEQFALINRVTGPYWWAYWGGTLPLLLSQLLWWPRLRRSFGFALGLALALLFYPGLEWFLVLLTSRHHDYLPSSWAMTSPDAPLRLVLGFGGLGLLCWRRWWRHRPQG